MVVKLAGSSLFSNDRLKTGGTQWAMSRAPRVFYAGLAHSDIADQLLDDGSFAIAVRSAISIASA